MADIQDVIQSLVKFRDERDWKQFHDPKNLAIAISIEAAELNELFLWKGPEEVAQIDQVRIKEELADVIAYALLLAESYSFDVSQIVKEKMALNAEKYPIDKAKSSSKKYNELD